MITINSLTHYAGGKLLYDNASLHIKPGGKIGLIGLNGTGKSTLLKIITNQLTPDQGKVSMSKDCSIGFLTQDLLSEEFNESIRTVAMQAFEETLQIQRQIDQVLKKMETDYSDDLVDKLTTLQEAFAQAGGYEIQAKTDKVLEGIGFKTSDLDRPLNEFSGGWRMRVMLAKLLLQKPSLLLLDEPTNHLDIVSIQWVEEYLKSYPNAYIVISHDQAFLDNVTNRTVEIAQQDFHVFTGNFSFYKKEKALQAELQQNAYVNQQKKIKQTERFIERFRSKSSKASQVQSRIKALDKLEKVEQVVDYTPKIHFRFKLEQAPGKEIALLKDIDKAYGDITILKQASATVERGAKIALIGANGKGKTTVLKLIAGQEEPNNGLITLGHNVTMGFYAQHQLESLNGENTVLEELMQAGTKKSETEIRSILGAFLFSKDEVKKYIKVLSGGEKARVALAKMLAQAPNFLLLDEPTNHLDMLSINILIQALQQYEGTFITVSHNRYFISELANTIWYLQDQNIKEYPGNYEEYAYWSKKNNMSLS